MGNTYIAPTRVEIEDSAPQAAISFGVGENETKRIPGDFEAQAIRALARRYRTLWIDRRRRAAKKPAVSQQQG